MSRIVWLTVMAACLGAPAWAADAPPAGYTVVLRDDFNQDSLGKFDFTDAKAWAMADEAGNGVLELKGDSNYTPPVRSPLNIAWVKDLQVENFILDVKAKQTGKEYGHRDLCFFFGGQDATHFYYVHLATKADDHANSIFLVDGAPRVSIATNRTDGTAWTSDYHHIRIVRDSQAGLIEVYFDNMEKPVMTAGDRHFGKGRIGLGSFDDQGRFEDLTIYIKGESK